MPNYFVINSLDAVAEAMKFVDIPVWMWVVGVAATIVLFLVVSYFVNKISNGS